MQAGIFARNIFAERLYADQYTVLTNESTERNIKIQDVWLAKADDMFARFPAAHEIYHMSGAIRN